MKRVHIVIVALLLGIAAVVGLTAATRTASLGATTRTKSVSDRLIAKRSHQLDRLETALRRELKQKPPKLPPVPSTSATPSPGALASARPAAAPAAPPRVLFVRPQPIVQVVHSRHGDDGHEAEHSARGGGGGEADD